ncbi:MAG: TetR/AcrR family transcriptional regulator [Cellulomonas sp.]|uniref:TetR/AcrR family transcriptional regulator n=1 Tax=Cellulomonas TaxID=1707 RepID=UPI00065271A3|nr:MULTISPECIES: TetR/AcrR family transcriptional regulator [Cellulomonas]KMM47129.1 TetR family transcriptional regulator [Cellulomonas sp. A375-1]MCR6647057.1 TetR/AcrR family transcriptional regulator [Cellulomonas sp.]MCR6706088.1 TetR/AcrR family transcriptional regulator [Cellulomonas sp.]
MSSSAVPSEVAVKESARAVRMSGDERREQILLAARHVFAEGGFAATTDEVARAAAISQPYVVRLFGSKRDLFVEVYRQAAGEVIEVLTAAAQEADPGEAMGRAYLELIEDRDLLRLLMHGFIASADEEVGRVARHCLGEAYRLFVASTGAEPDEARQFVAFGMLLNVLVAVDADAHRGEDAGMDALIDCVVLATRRAQA